MPDSPFDWKAYLTLAELLLEYIKSEEYAYRASVSRAYYAAYWSARTAIVANGGTVPDKGSHAMVWMSFDIPTKYTGRASTIGRQLKKLKALRESADYHALPNMTTEDAEIAIRQARRILEHIGSLSDEDMARLVQEAADVYEHFKNN
jgi:uncharacterized protein (UPF0332 family)